MNDPVALTFHGAAGTVTGSKTLLASGTRGVLVDCGLFQGERELRRRNRQPLPFDAVGLDAVALTHAHLDHCGYLPKLYDEGYGGRTYATASTVELAEIVLRDSGHLLEEEARHAAAYGWSKHAVPLPLYDEASAVRAVAHLTTVAFHAKQELAPEVCATWRPAGHILGSASVTVEAAGTRVLFSGDLGRPNHPLLREPDPPDDVDAVVVESTYGDRTHPDPDQQALADVINRTIARGGSVLIPAFAVDRTEVLLCALHELRKAREIPPVPIVLDSPMALRALDVYRAGLRTSAADVRPDSHRLGWHEVQALTTPEDSRRMNSPDFPTIIISASGMATGGRVLHHLRHQLPDPRHSVLLVGYQAAGTRGRALLEGAHNLKIFGQYVPVRAEVADVQGFSVHADADDILAWLGRMKEPPGVCLVNHGEGHSSAALRDRIADELGWNAVVPGPGERVVVSR